MATTINKQRQLTQLLALVRKAEPDSDERLVLEQFVYGLCRENATPEQADRAFKFLTERFFDWNEVRVSSTRELEDAFSGLADAEGRALRLIAFLQEVFEAEYGFNLDGLQKKGLKEAAKQLRRYQAANDYVVAWAIQRTLGGHAIPLDESTLRCVRRLGLIDAAQEDLEAIRSSLEHLVPKAKGPTFTDVVSRLAQEVCHEDEPHCSRCALNSECPTAHERGPAANGTNGRSGRPKPR